MIYLLARLQPLTRLGSVLHIHRPIAEKAAREGIWAHRAHRWAQLIPCPEGGGGRWGNGIADGYPEPWEYCLGHWMPMALVGGDLACSGARGPSDAPVIATSTWDADCSALIAIVD